jgi:hypothetical protein
MMIGTPLAGIPCWKMEDMENGNPSSSSWDWAAVRVLGNHAWLGSIPALRGVMLKCIMARVCKECSVKRREEGNIGLQESSV